MKRKKNSPTRFTRLVIYPAVGLAFILGLGVIILMAAGYKFSFNGGNFSLKKTGMIVLSTRPSDAQVYLDGKNLYKNTYPFLSTKISGLVPGNYLVSVKKEGYHPWSKNIRVYPDLVSWANYILLFPNELQADRVTTLDGYKHIGQNRTNRLLFMEKTNENKVREFFIYDTNENTVTKVWPGNTTPVEEWLRNMQINSVEFSSDNQKILLNLKDGNGVNFGIMDISSDTRLYSLRTQPSLSFTKMVWNPENANEIFGLSSGSLHRVNLNEDNRSTKIAEMVVDYSAKANNLIYYVRNEAGKYAVWRVQSDGNRDVEIYSGVNKSSGYSFEYSNKANALALLSKDDKTITLYYTIGNEPSSTVVSKNSTDLSWNKEGSKLLYYNENQVFCYDWEKQDEIETTINEKIREANWYFDNYHFFLNTDQGLSVIEFDGLNKIKISSKNEKTFLINQSSFLNLIPEKNIPAYYQVNISF